MYMQQVSRKISRQDMRYSIMGFDQAEVLKLRKTVNGKELFVDLADLLIINTLADYPNRRGIVKINVDGSEYFWVDYQSLIDDIPIVNIKKQALADRIAKLVELEVIEKYTIRRNTGVYTHFRMGRKYESLKYSGKSSEPDGSVVDYSSGKVPGYATNTSIQDNNITDNKEKKKEKKLDFVETEFEEPFLRFLDYRSKLGRPIKDVSLKASYNNLKKLSNNNPDTAREIVEQSIANQWQGLFELKTQHNNGTTTKNDRFDPRLVCKFTEEDCIDDDI